MTQAELQRLNRRFGASARIGFRNDEHGLPVASLANRFASAEVSLYGAHVLSYRPAGHGPVLFLSKQSSFEEGKPIRGGIPICWPWFGKADKPELPMHGFARTSMWSVVSTSYSDESTELSLGLADSPETKKLFPYSFATMLTVKVGHSLRLELTTRNAGIAPMTITQAFHNYLRVLDISRVEVDGLDGAKIDDRLTSEKKVQQERLSIDRETDAIFFPKKPLVRVMDAGLKRQIDVTFSGSRSAVVWNPWIDKAKRMDDFGDDEYRQMLCVEPANTIGTEVHLKPGEKYTLVCSIQPQLV